MNTLSAWAIRIDGNDHEWIINHTSRGGAKAEAFRGLRDAWPDLRYTSLRSRNAGAPVTSVMLGRVAQRRGVPWAIAGARVVVTGERGGYIVDGNYSDNFDVLLDGGGVVNCHPGDIKQATQGDPQ
jgi:hypothetical protein